MTASYETYSRVMTTNPFTGSAWTIAEVNAWAVNFGVENDANKWARVTQVYVTIDYTPANTPSTLTGVPTNPTINELVPYSFDADATDPESPPQTLTFSLVGAPTGATIDSSTGVFNWTPSEAQGPGAYPFTVRVSDGIDNTDASITITVNEVNSVPVADDQTVNIDEDTVASITLSATDSDLPENDLTYSIETGPTNGTISDFNPVTGELTYTPSENYFGPDSFTFTANDGVSDSNIATVTITVNSVNDAPVITLLSVDPVNLTVGDTYTDAGATAYDEEDGDITGSIVVTGLPIDTSALGTFTIRYNVSDSAGNPAVEVTRTVNVNPTTPPPPTTTTTVPPAPYPAQYTPPTGVVAGAATEQGQVAGASTACNPYLLKFIKLGASNDPEEVKKLQSFLNEYLGLDLPISGIYDQATYEAVKQFQLLLKNEVLAPWVAIGCLPSENIATGYVYRTTTRAINNIFCPTPIPDVSDERCVGGIIIGLGEESGTVLGEATTTPTTTTVTTPLETTEETGLTGTQETGVVSPSQNWFWYLIGIIIIGGAVYLAYSRRKK